MSHQHFYSRVPARVSLFNKRDGFDTFAHSLLLEREFILGPLAIAYENKLTIHDPTKVWRGEIPMVYSQTVLEGGGVAQSAIRYIPKDFTGERSAYIAHTLILTEKEREEIFFTPDHDAFTPGMFYTDISGFNLTDRRAVGNPNLTDKAYLPRPLSNVKAVISKYNPEMIKSFVFSVLSSVIGDGREVYFRLPCENARASDEALELINAVMSILPYSLREKLSFVSYISRLDSYQGYKLKCVSSESGIVSPEQGVFYDFATNQIYGQSAEYSSSVAHAGFLYSLFSYPTVKDEFHEFVEDIVDAYEDLDFTIEALREMIFVFWQCSGKYVESSILPNDEAISDFLDTYEKYRKGLSTEYRVQAYRCLARYAEAQIAIPDSVFSRLTRLYLEECVEAKAVALDVLLRLIHVDLMRTSLFCFISRFYQIETDSVKAVIISNLCRVFYGGFLQQNILAFFDLYFRREPVHTRDLILDKLLLSIRTPEVQGQIVAFLDRHYSVLNSAQKLKICSTCLEMIPECDELSVMLVTLINRRIGRDGGEISKLMNEQLSGALTFSLLSGDSRMAAILVDTPGFCEDIVLRQAINQAAGVDMIVGILAAQPAHKRIEKLLRAYTLSIGMPPDSYHSLIHRFSLVQVAIYPCYLWDIMACDSNAAAMLPIEVLEYFRQVIIYPAVNYTLHHVFSKDNTTVDMDRVVVYARENPMVAASGEYTLISGYLEMVRKCGHGDPEAAFKIASALPPVEELRRDIADYMKKTEYELDELDDEAAITFELVINYLHGDSFNFDLIYTRYQMQFEDNRLEERNMNSIMADRRSAVDAIDHIIFCASAICDVSDQLASLVVDDESGLRTALKDFIELYGPGAGGILKKKTKESYFAIEEITEELIEERNAKINSARDAMKFLFRRK